MSRLSLALILSFVGVLTACGGAGGGKSKSSSSLPVSSLVSLSSVVASSSLPITSSSIPDSSNASSSEASSFALSPSSSSISSAFVGEIKINGTVATQGDSSSSLDSQLLAVEINVLDSNRQILTTSNPVAGRNSSSDNFRFNADVDGTNATSITINVSYPGLTSFSRNLALTEVINFEAVLQAAPVQSVGIEESQSISGRTIDGFTVNVSAENDDRQRDSLQIQIPRSLLPDDTASLDVAVRTFDPNEPEDAQLFPGAYADSDGNNLVSVAFNFTQIATASGEPLVQAMRKVRQEKIAKAGGLHKVADDEPVIINRQIPAQSCRLLESLGDSDSLTAGFQVPVYTYNPKSGVWDLLGHGTIYNQAGEIAAETQKVFDCTAQNYFLEILVSNEIFLSEWWNLDYPLVFREPINFCARVQLKNPEGENLAGITGFVIDDNDSMDFTTVSFTTNSEGYADITVSQAGSESEASLFIFSTENYTHIRKTITLSENCASPQVQVVEIRRPALCSVSGNISFKNGIPLEREFLYGISTETSQTFGFDYVYSDKDGNYRLSLPCKGEYQITPVTAFWFWGQAPQPFLINTDGHLQPDEQSDDGKSVVLKPMQVDFGEPKFMGYYDRAQKRLMIYFYGPYSTFPMNFSGTITTYDGGISYGTVSGTASAKPLDENSSFYNLALAEIDYDLPPTENQFYLLTINVTDALNNQWPNVQAVLTDGEPEEVEDDGGEYLSNP